jgi:hypothetical protein
LRCPAPHPGGSNAPPGSWATRWRTRVATRLPLPTSAKSSCRDPGPSASRVVRPRARPRKSCASSRTRHVQSGQRGFRQSFNLMPSKRAGNRVASGTARLHRERRRLAPHRARAPAVAIQAAITGGDGVASVWQPGCQHQGTHALRLALQRVANNQWMWRKALGLAGPEVPPTVSRTLAASPSDAPQARPWCSRPWSWSRRAPSAL